ncbi:nitrite reductase (NAD(P)H) small subunit [Alteromonas aestuariivivens]|uniref:Nitrite reductase (NAD(P)H) small subunit n=1 Tax=Alteromonas aestuariivivens TaxID=1938339 RepID=A0A3D8MCR7_9ALTE|nr:nitrite reductase small subunit NirD [Alteromonas aestuariivivens]RDV28019.1 nitrite reductase (NAD(P)H) small subunit [Alteromonas aestuariivivens]
MQVKVDYVPEWHDVCAESDLVPNSGVCALIEEQQIALFAVKLEGEQKVFAISNWDPIGKANVMYRGILGSVKGDPVVASPLYKEHYSLTSGQCVEREDASVMVFDIKLENGRVWVAV